MFRLEWTERGRREFLAAISYIAEQDPLNAELVRERVHRTLTNLESFSLGLPAPKGTWKIYVPKTPYFVIFRRDSEGNVTICGFVHASRDWENIDWEKF